MLPLRPTSPLPSKQHREMIWRRRRQTTHSRSSQATRRYLRGTPTWAPASASASHAALMPLQPMMSCSFWVLARDAWLPTQPHGRGYAVLVGVANGDGAWHGLVMIVELIDPHPYSFTVSSLPCTLIYTVTYMSDRLFTQANPNPHFPPHLNCVGLTLVHFPAQPQALLSPTY